MNLVELRKMLGISQMQVAKDMGVSINSYINWERGVMNPNKENEQKLKEFFEELENKKKEE